METPRGLQSPLPIFYHDSNLPPVTQLLTGMDSRLLVVIRQACRGRGMDAAKIVLVCAKGFVCLQAPMISKTHFNGAVRVRQASAQGSESTAIVETCWICLSHNAIPASWPIYVSRRAHYGLLCQVNVFRSEGEGWIWLGEEIINRQIHLHKSFQGFHLGQHTAASHETDLGHLFYFLLSILLLFMFRCSRG